ncbi:MAG: tRNA (N(6)-L-threonylcarbamoyladenosine(37)-C(2))-methylthiotransferase MtaB [Candidatus Omnitrophica bacterium]|nr:tRNA (N(6)-L-threonylcarbamoyladenosine(37)-C(2))-methylthiotransferase MtaB [Candidatus Omnitrophota bacterium]
MNSQISISKRFYIHTLGCKVNQYETQAMREILLKAGFKECLAKDIADIYIINTCTVTQHADREARHMVGMFHRSNPNAKIVVAGCLVEKNADEISFLPGVAYTVKNSEKSRIDKILNGEEKKAGERQDELTITAFKGRTKAFIKIQDGCENRCSYCKVPLVRNVLRSKPLDKITEEVKALTANGFKEIILAGICLGAWGRDLVPSGMAASVGLKDLSLMDVLKAIEGIDGNFRVRLSSIEPKYVTDELIKFVAGSKRICRHLHIPLQSGDDEILKRMNRPYTTAEYRAIIEKARAAMGDVAISTDVMVGFPAETESNFTNTLEFVKGILPARTHIFTYSKREGTPAATMSGEVDEAVAKKRYCTLRAATLMSSYTYRTKFERRALDILVENKRDKHTGLLTGYSDNYIRILFDGPDELMGNIVPVRITDMTLAYTKGIKIS